MKAALDAAATAEAQLNGGLLPGEQVPAEEVPVDETQSAGTAA